MLVTPQNAPMGYMRVWWNICIWVLFWVNSHFSTEPDVHFDYSCQTVAGGSTLMLSNIKGPYFEVHSKETVGF